MLLFPTTPAWARRSWSGKAIAREREDRHHEGLFDAMVGMTLVLGKKEVALYLGQDVILEENFVDLG